MDVSVQYLKDEIGKEGLHRKKEIEALEKEMLRLRNTHSRWAVIAL